MNEAPFQEWAARLLEDQLARLGELRNGNPRDGGFKLWRQTTLTVVQRLWPGNLQKSERFRRIPFTAPGAKPTRDQVREFYERGCSEAAAYLRELILEVSDGGLDLEPSLETQAVEGELESRPQLEVDVETENLAPIVLGPTAMPRVEEDEPVEEEASEEVEASPVNPTPLVIPSDPFASRPAIDTGRPAVPDAPAPGRRRLLKEMLGFMDEPGSSPKMPSAVPAAASGTDSTSDSDGYDWGGDDTSNGSEVVSEEQGSNGDEAASGDPSTDIFHRSPVLAAARPVEVARTPLPPLKSATANALMALAGEVATLGVPEGHRAAARAALTGLAHQFDQRSANWDSLRHVMSVVMDYPDLARRVVPMLVPYLDLL